MPTFTYQGLNEHGDVVNGVIEAYDDIEAMAQAREQVRIVQSVKPVKAKTGLGSIEITKPKVKHKALSLICSQFAIILRSGMPTNRAVALVADQCDNKYLKQVLTEVASDVASGHGLADSFENKGENLPRVFIETLRAGEESGRLEESFERLATYYEKRGKVASKIASAMAYPIFVFVIAIVVVAVMMVMVIPSIIEMVESLGTETPAITQFLIDVSNWFGENWLILLIIIVLLVIGIRAFGRTERGKNAYAKLFMKLPVVGVINVFSGAAQFANTMATLIASGLTVSRAVEITSRVMDNYVLQQEVGRMEAGLHEGRSLADCMKDITWFPQTLVEMSAVGENTGALEETLGTMGDFYDNETQRVTDRALAMLEPAMLVVMAIFAGFIVIALYLPMFTMYAGMS